MTQSVCLMSYTTELETGFPVVWVNNPYQRSSETLIPGWPSFIRLDQTKMGIREISKVVCVHQSTVTLT